MRFWLLVMLLCSSSFALANDCAWKNLNKQTITRAGLSLGLLAVYQASELGKGAILNDQPRWTDEEINAYDQLGEKLRWDPDGLDKGAASMSDVMLALTVASTPFLALAEGSRGACLAEDSAAIVETTSAILLLTQAAKFAAKRERPFARDLSEEEREEICLKPRECVDVNLSFFSGHSSMTFGVTLAAATIAAERGYPSALAVYTFGTLGAGLTAYLRVAAGKHYLSDVTLGALVGVGLGYAIPKYLHPLTQGKEREAHLVPLLDKDLQGVALSGSW